MHAHRAAAVDVDGSDYEEELVALLPPRLPVLRLQGAMPLVLERQDPATGRPSSPLHAAQPLPATPFAATAANEASIDAPLPPERLRRLQYHNYQPAGRPHSPYRPAVPTGLARYLQTDTLRTVGMPAPCTPSVAGGRAMGRYPWAPHLERPRVQRASPACSRSRHLQTALGLTPSAAAQLPRPSLLTCQLAERRASGALLTFAEKYPLQVYQLQERRRGVKRRWDHLLSYASRLPHADVRPLTAIEGHRDSANTESSMGDGPKALVAKLQRRLSSECAPTCPMPYSGTRSVAAKLSGRDKHLAPVHAPPSRPSSSRPAPPPSPQVRAPTRMPARVVGGQRMAVPAYVRTTPFNSERRARREAALGRASRDRAQQMAAEGATQDQIDSIAAALANSTAVAQLGASDGTLTKDDLAWSYWDEFSHAYGWDPVVSRTLAISFPDLLASRLGLFLLWVYPKIKGRRLPDANPRSVLTAYPGAICRILKRDHKLPVPRATTYEAEAKGLLRGYKRIYGVLALAPKRRQPMRRSIWRRVEALQTGDQLVGRAPWMTHAHLDTVGRRAGRVLSETAHRLGEIVSYTADEINYLVRSHVTFLIGGIVRVDPTRGELLSMQAGDTVFLAACASKPDQFGEQNCTFPSTLRYDGTPLSAAGALRAIELDHPCRGSARARMPVFADEDGNPYSYSTLNGWLHTLMVAIVGSGAASTLSWHSFRIELACRLRAAGCPDSTIQLICRWACPESVQTYAQLGISQNVAWLTKAADVQHDAVRTNNLPQLDNSNYFADFDGDRTRPQHTAADDDSGNDGSLPRVRDRLSLRWGDVWFAGVVTSCKRGLDSRGYAATVHHVLYDAAHGFRPSRHWHALSDEDWRRI